MNDCVGRILLNDMASLPSWFNAGQAAAILRQQGKRFALITDRAGVSRIATRAALASVDDTKSAEACAIPLAVGVGVETPLSAALELMDRHHVDLLPVRGGGPVGSFTGLLVGIVLREDIVACLQAALSEVSLAA